MHVSNILTSMSHLIVITTTPFSIWENAGTDGLSCSYTVAMQAGFILSSGTPLPIPSHLCAQVNYPMEHLVWFITSIHSSDFYQMRNVLPMERAGTAVTVYLLNLRLAFPSFISFELLRILHIAL